MSVMSILASGIRRVADQVDGRKYLRRNHLDDLGQPWERA